MGVVLRTLAIFAIAGCYKSAGDGGRGGVGGVTSNGVDGNPGIQATDPAGGGGGGTGAIQFFRDPDGVSCAFCAPGVLGG